MISVFITGGLSMMIASNVISGITKSQNLSSEPKTFDSFPPTNIPQENSFVSSAKESNNSLRVIKTSKNVSSTNDPIWRVELVVNDKVVDYVDALIGRSYRQNSNRNISGNKSPLPIGTYSIDSLGISKAPFDDPELGRGYWIPIIPLFSTGRSVLGIHQDPSWGKTNGESGTSGCIGLKSAEETEKVENWIRKYKIHTLTVQS